MASFKFLLSAAVATVAVAAASGADNPVVTTTLGPVRGTYNPASGISSFKGIPFALPPTGALRFESPKPAVPWPGTLDGTKFRAGCMAECPPSSFPHPKFMCASTVSEDCLFLNVYVPGTCNATTAGAAAGGAGGGGGAAAAPLPVIFFMPGGDYMFGSAGCDLYDGQQLASTQNVIVVTTNYRLGIFGALYTGTVTGNFQTKDQRMAMKWVQTNIRSFGGDPAAVTISGQSAGAASVSAHLASPPSAGLFAKAIVVSNPFSLVVSDPMVAIQLGRNILEKLNCTLQGGMPELECLRSVPAETILAITGHSNYPFEPSLFLARMMRYSPVLDPIELPYQPLYAYHHGHIAKVPVMIGTVANESVQFIHEISKTPVSPLEFDLIFELAFGPKMTAAAKKMYGNPPASEGNDVRPFMSFIATDYIFYCSTRWAAGGLSKYVPTFVWYYSYLTSMNEWIFGKNLPECVHNVCHAQDLSSIFFPYKYIMFPGAPAPSLDDNKMAHVVQTAWGNFARSSTPDPLPVFSSAFDNSKNSFTRLPHGAAGADRSAVQFPLFNFTQDILVNYSAPPTMLPRYHGHYCDVWDEFGYMRR